MISKRSHPAHCRRMANSLDPLRRLNPYKLFYFGGQFRATKKRQLSPLIRQMVRKFGLYRRERFCCISMDQTVSKQCGHTKLKLTTL